MFSCISYIPLSVVAVFIKAPVRRKTISEALCKDVHSVDDQRNYIGTLRCSVYGFALVGLSLVVAFGVSIAAIKFLMGYIKKHDFKVFGWYRIVLGIIVLICGLVGVIG